VCARAAPNAGASATVSVVIDEPAGALFAEQNESIDRGVTVAVDELDAGRGPLRVRLAAQRLDGLSASGVRARLRAAGAQVLILPCDTDSEYSLLSDAAPLRILMLAPCDPEPAIGERYPTFWAVGMGANAEAAALAQFIALDGYRWIYVVDVSGAQSFGPVMSYFRQAAAAAGRDVLGSATISLSTRDVAALARSIKSQRHPVVVVTPMPPPYLARLVASLSADGVEEPFFAFSTADTPLTVSTKLAPLTSLYFTSYGFLRQEPAAQTFQADYQRRFRVPVLGGFPGLGLDTVRLLEQAIASAHSTAPAALDRALLNGLALSGVGLADRSYVRGSDHEPLTEVGIAKDESGSIGPVYASIPTDVPLP
jgi:ABC-type branched-subunit amino acid transport system substrate-binding protein